VTLHKSSPVLIAALLFTFSRPAAAAHRLTAVLAPQTHAGTWRGAGSGYEFHSHGFGYRLLYDFSFARHWHVGAAYRQTRLRLNEDHSDSYAIRGSATRMESYFLKSGYCFSSHKPFVQEICPAFRFGRETYPLLRLSNTSNLSLEGHRAIVGGVDLDYQSPITETVLFRASVGYDSSFRGDSPPFTYFLNLGAAWALSAADSFGFNVGWINRRVSADDSVSGTTRTTSLALRLLYTRTL
jgi:hypothetical protein